MYAIKCKKQPFLLQTNLTIILYDLMLFMIFVKHWDLLHYRGYPTACFKLVHFSCLESFGQCCYKHDFLAFCKICKIKPYKLVPISNLRLPRYVFSILSPRLHLKKYLPANLSKKAKTVILPL